MTTCLTQQPALRHLADRIESDIRRRGLCAGDAYLTADEVGRLFDIHPRQAGRAMQLLASRNVLRRRPGAGTFIGDAAPTADRAATRQVVRVIAFSGKLLYTRQVGQMIGVLRAVFPGHDIQVHPLDPPDEPAQLAAALRTAQQRGDTAGILIWGATRPMQQAVVDAALPAVLLGGVAPGVTGLPFVASDQREAGRLMAQYLIERGHRRIVLFMRDQWGCGDNNFCDGIDEQVAAHPGVVRILRSLPADEPTVRDYLASLRAAAEPVTAAICRNRFYAQCILAARADDAPPIDVIYDGMDPDEVDAAGTPFVALQGGFEAALRTAADMLRQIANNQPLQRTQHLIPVQLIEPGASSR